MTDKLPRFKSSCFLDVDYKDLYPLDKKKIDKILEGYGVTENYLSEPLSGTLVYDNEYKTQSVAIVIINKPNPSKKPSIEILCKSLFTNNKKRAIIILAGYSKSCQTYIRSFCSINLVQYRLQNISILMKPERRSTVPILLGRYANQSYGKTGEPKQKITILIPEKGFPDIGFAGKLNASDIYKILESKVEPSNNSFEAKGFDVVMTAFEELVSILDDGKNITSTKWNGVMDKSGGVFEYLESEE